MAAGEGLREFWRSWGARLGVALLVLMTGISLYVAASYPWDFGLRVWNNPSYWAENPKAVPPSWTNIFAGGALPPHTVLKLTKPTSERATASARELVYEFRISYPYEDFPTIVSFSVGEITYRSRPPTVELYLSRPDGGEVRLLRFTVSGPRAGEKPPYRRYFEAPGRVILSGEEGVRSALAKLMRNVYGLELTAGDVAYLGVERIMFGKPARDGGFEVLKGEYLFKARILMRDPGDEVGYVKLVVGGRVYGLMGTDTLGRDLAVGLLFGFPIALIIGFLTSTVTTAIGASAGIVSGYIGGKVDTGIQRLSDVIINIPLLPILIFFTFVLGAAGSKLWVIIAVLIAFSWPGLTIVVRPMVMQIKSGQFIEAAVAIGAPRWWIMLRHVFPQLAPFILAQLIFFTPSAILAEAALSFLGLGDPSIPTWGQILEYGFRSGGLYAGYWWWIVPPGVLIMLAALTFALIALALEPVVNPRLRRR